MFQTTGGSWGERQGGCVCGIRTRPHPADALHSFLVGVHPARGQCQPPLCRWLSGGAARRSLIFMGFAPKLKGACALIPRDAQQQGQRVGDHRGGSSSVPLLGVGVMSFEPPKLAAQPTVSRPPRGPPWPRPPSVRLEGKPAFGGQPWLQISLSETKRPCCVARKTVTVSGMEMTVTRGRTSVKR